MFQLTKKIVLSALLGGMMFSNANAQDDVIISGGNSVSSMVTADGKVYVWGSNQVIIGNSALSGVLGLGSSVNQSFITTPTLVTFPGNVSIKQVNSGSGAHFVALDCDGGLWSWGANLFGQVGIGTSGNVVNTPTRVKLGVLASEASKFDPAATGFITKGIKTVYAAGSNSYAILTDGRLIAWGSNDAAGSYYGSNGQLGDGTQISKSVPVFVKTQFNTPLTGVISVASSDGVTFALLDEDGDGSGTVYSWGNGSDGTLGRNALGTGNPSSYNTVQDSFARPVWYSNTSMMDNIIKISAGDVYGMALDMNGYVWTWGNGAWNNATGNTTRNDRGSNPQRVLAGTTTGASNDELYLLAKSISGGQSFGMAVTIDGKPVAWGGDPTSCTIGGITGTGAAKAGIVPSYILSGGITHSDVINIFRGDTWGYYQRMDGSIYVWGCNNNGQLGIGNTTNQTTAVQMTPPTNTKFRDPFPMVAKPNKDIEICESKLSALSPIILDNGFELSATLAPSYRVRWYKDEIEVSGSPFNATTGKTYKATSVGNYRVTLEYLGTNGSCGGYPISETNRFIIAFEKTYSTDNNLTYCSTVSSLSVNTSNTNNPIYQWYATSSSTTPIAKTVGNNSVIVDLSSLPMVETDKMVYVEETSQASGVLLKKTQACDTSWNYSTQIYNGTYMTQTGLTTSIKDVTINSLSINLRSQVYMSTTPITATINFGIYAGKMDNLGWRADETQLLHSFIYNFSKTNTSLSSLTTTEIVKVPVNFTLPDAGIYFISLKNAALSNNSGSGQLSLSLGTGSCIQTMPIQGTVPGISFTNTSKAFQMPSNSEQGNFFNIEFSTGQGFCDRIPVLVKRKCPCYKPSAVTLKDASLLGQKTISVCTGTGTLATIKGTVTTNAPAFNGYYYSIYKKGSTPVYTAGTTVTSKALTASDAGTWILRAEDGTFMDANCYLEDSVKYEVLPSTNIFCKATGIEADEQKNGIRISPSPFKDQFVLETLGMDKVIVIDQRGVLIEERSISNIQNIQMGQNWSSGLYFLQIIGNGISKTTKVIKEQ